MSQPNFFLVHIREGLFLCYHGFDQPKIEFWKHNFFSIWSCSPLAFSFFIIWRRRRVCRNPRRIKIVRNWPFSLLFLFAFQSLSYSKPFGFILVDCSIRRKDRGRKISLAFARYHDHIMTYKGLLYGKTERRGEEQIWIAVIKRHGMAWKLHDLGTGITFKFVDLIFHGESLLMFRANPHVPGHNFSFLLFFSLKRPAKRRLCSSSLEHVNREDKNGVGYSLMLHFGPQSPPWQCVCRWFALW